MCRGDKADIYKIELWSMELIFQYDADSLHFLRLDKFQVIAVILSGITQSWGMRIPWRWSEGKGECERQSSLAGMERSGVPVQCSALLGLHKLAFLKSFDVIS